MLREAVLNITSDGSRLRLMALLVAGTSIVSGLLLVRDWEGLDDQIATRERAGWTVYTLAAEQPTIPAESCLGLSTLSFVRSAAAVEPHDVVEIAAVGRAVPLVLVAGELPHETLTARVGEGAAMPAMALGEGLAASLAIPADVTGFVRTDSVTPVVVRADASMYGLGSALLVSSQEVEFVSRCIVSVSPYAAVDAIEPALMSAVDVTSSAATLVVHRVGSTGDFDTHPYDAFLARPERLFGVVSGVFLGLCMLGIYRSRSSELAIYRLSGMSSATEYQLLAVEITLLCAIGLLTHVFAILALRSAEPRLSASAWWMLVGVGAFAATSAVAALSPIRQNVVDRLKDR